MEGGGSDGGEWGEKEGKCGTDPCSSALRVTVLAVLAVGTSASVQFHRWQVHLERRVGEWVGDGAYPESAGVAQVISEDKATASWYVAPNMPADCAEHLHTIPYRTMSYIRWTVTSGGECRTGRGTGDGGRGAGRMLVGKTDSGAERSTRKRNEGEGWAMPMVTATYVLAVPAL
jgi:hypothetical protein